MSINLTDEIEVKTKKGKLGAAKQIFLEGDTQTVENEIQDINSRHNDLNSKHESLSSTVSEHTNQIESNQNQITANKSTQDAKNASLDANMAKLNTRDDQITELVRGITATGGASVATTVTYDNTSSHLASATVQGAIDELQGSKIDKTSILQELGNAEDKVMSQKSVSDAIAVEETRAKEAEENLVGKVTELSAEVSEQTIIREERRIDLIIDTAFNAYGLKLGDKFTSTAGSASGVASNSFIVREGEVYHLKGRGNEYAYKGYFVVNQDDVVIQIIDDNVEYNLDLIIGEGAKHLFVNCVNYNEDVDGVWKVKAESLKDVVLQMQSEGSNETIIDTIDMSNKIVVGYAYNLGGDSVGQKYTSTPGTSATSAYARIAVNPNSKYEIRGKGSQYAFRFYAFLDANLTILELSTEEYDTRNDALVLTPPSNAAILIVNFTNYNASLDSLIRKDSYNVADSIKLIYKPLNSTNIVCFGDSITQFYSNIGMRYSDYLEENGANVVNVGIGGTQIRQRATPSANPTSVEQAYGGLDIASLVNAAASNDYSIVEASASYIQSNATPQYNPIDVIEKLKLIDWNKVGIVTILGGTNDWNNGNNLGEATDENATSTLGALNHIIKTLLTAYPHLRVYVFTPLVRYVASSLAERTDATWAGKMTNGEGKTILDYVDAIKYVAENNCIPVCDMYRTMGWNKYNFSQYFDDDDGVHPYKGFKEIADRMQSFILSNL